MTGETNLEKLIQSMTPELHSGDYVFCTVETIEGLSVADVLGFFKEKEGTTLILKRKTADALQLPYSFVASWISLNIHSSLEATGLTAAFSKALAGHGISCNVVAGYYHDHLFVAKSDGEKALEVLKQLSASSAPVPQT